MMDSERPSLILYPSFYFRRGGLFSSFISLQNFFFSYEALRCLSSRFGIPDPVYRKEHFRLLERCFGPKPPILTTLCCGLFLSRLFGGLFAKQLCLCAGFSLLSLLLLLCWGILPHTRNCGASPICSANFGLAAMGGQIAPSSRGVKFGMNEIEGNPLNPCFSLGRRMRNFCDIILNLNGF